MTEQMSEREGVAPVTPEEERRFGDHGAMPQDETGTDAQPADDDQAAVHPERIPHIPPPSG